MAQYDSPVNTSDTSRRRRNKPFLGGTVSAAVAAGVDAEAERTGGNRSLAMERVLRRGLGLPEAPPQAA